MFVCMCVVLFECYVLAYTVKLYVVHGRYCAYKRAHGAVTVRYSAVHTSHYTMSYNTVRYRAISHRKRFSLVAEARRGIAMRCDVGVCLNSNTLRVRCGAASLRYALTHRVVSHWDICLCAVLKLYSQMTLFWKYPQKRYGQFYVWKLIRLKTKRVL